MHSASSCGLQPQDKRNVDLAIQNRGGVQAGGAYHWRLCLPFLDANDAPRFQKQIRRRLLAQERQGVSPDGDEKNGRLSSVHPIRMHRPGDRPRQKIDSNLDGISVSSERYLPSPCQHGFCQLPAIGRRPQITSASPTLSSASTWNETPSLSAGRPDTIFSARIMSARS